GGPGDNIVIQSAVAPIRAASALRARREITASGRLLVRRDGIVPLAVEIVTRDVDRLHLSFSDLEAFGVEVSIDLAAYFETCFGARRADELNDDLMTDQRLAPPVHGDEGEQAMLDLVPFAGARRQVGHGYFQVGLIGEALQFALP